MRPRDDRGTPEDDGRWWRLDFTMILVLMVLIAFLVIITMEVWHPDA